MQYAPANQQHSRHETGGGATARQLSILQGMLVFAALTLAGCPTHNDEHKNAAGLPPEAAAKFGELTEETLAPFTTEQVAVILPNQIHQAHSKAGLACNKCHTDLNPLSMQAKAELCGQCHEAGKQGLVVTQPVWQQHCLVCHYFKGDSLTAETEPPAKEFCQGCHQDEVAGPDIYGFYSHGMKGELACRSCHRPHADPPVYATDNCASCHGVFFENQLVKGGHSRCSLCHQPHWWKPDPQLQCRMCHSAPPGVLAHQIGVHPDDCLKCHNPHFEDQAIKGGLCQQCHDNRSYIAGGRVPAPHRNCQNCHRMSDFRFRGFDACAKCHSYQGSNRAKPDVPAQHQQCANCHKPHSWRASFGNTCGKCHDLSKPVEHRLEFHPQDCAKCHDPHLVARPPESGDCNGCHGSKVFPQFNAASPEMHLVCENCHDASAISERHKYEFVGAESSCQLCHGGPPENADLTWADVPTGHTQCQACHPAHTWQAEVGEQTCGVCHSGELESVKGNPLHSDCRSCHTPGHEMQFAGVEMSCAICHAQQFQETAPLGKNDCMLCHSRHDFKADPTSCTMCHSEPPGTHSAAGHQECLTCHQLHSFQADKSLCTICHADRQDHFPDTPDCTACHTFAE